MYTCIHPYIQFAAFAAATDTELAKRLERFQKIYVGEVTLRFQKISKEISKLLERFR